MTGDPSKGWDWVCDEALFGKRTHVYTNWRQLPVDAAGKPIWLKECPENWELPDDVPPPDQGSYKGYTNRYTFSNSNADDQEDTRLDDKVRVKRTFYNESEDNNAFDGVAKAGCIIGFGAFGIAIVIVTIMIAIDMRKRMAMYDEYIADDL